MGNKITKQKLGSIVWESANKLRKNLEAHEYKDYILGILLYKFLCEKQTNWLLSNGIWKSDLKCLDSKFDFSNFKFDDNTSFGSTEEIEDTKHSCIETNGYFIEYRNLFNSWIENKNVFEIQDFQLAFNEFSRSINEKYDYLFQDIFSVFEKSLDKLGSNSTEQKETINNLIDTMNKIPTSSQDYDVLGFIYEYLIAQFASSAGKKAGEFYTPHEVSDLMSKIIAYHLKDKNTISIYDPTSGSGSLLLNIGDEFKKYNKGSSPVTYYAQELKNETFNLTRMNLIMRNINPNEINVRRGDTLETDWPMFKNEDLSTYKHLTVDAVVSNPPYSQEWSSEKHTNDPRYIEYGIAPKKKADYAFLLHDLYHVDPRDGIMAIVLPHGVLFRGNAEKQIRQKLVENHQIDTIIGLPSNMFFGTGIPTIIMILKKQRPTSDILFVDASQLYIKEGKNNKFSKSQIKKIADTVNNRQEVENFSKIVKFEEIKENDFNLNISRYIDNFKKQEQYDLHSLMIGGISKQELDSYNSFFSVFKNIKDKLFKLDQNNYLNLKVDQDQIRDIVYLDSDVNKYLEHFKQLSNNFLNHFKTLVPSLIDIKNINSAEIEKLLSDYIFNQVEQIDLIDKYDLYQIVIDNIDVIKENIELISKYYIDNENEAKQNIHLEILKDESTVIWEAKKKNSEDVVVKEWTSTILDPVYIKNNYFKDIYDYLNSQQERIEEINSEIENTLSLIEQEDKTEDIYDFEKEEFNKTGIENLAKSIKKSNQIVEVDSFEEKIVNVSKLYEQQVEIKKYINSTNKQLINDSYNKYLSLSENEFYELLVIKWLNNIVRMFEQKPVDVIDSYISKFELLSKKYEDTLEDINNQILKSEKELLNLLKDLTGEESDMRAIDELIKILGGN
ncbi:type I restriction-modification system subunit M [Mycoplasma feriruminatoris]|uniref:site-specific DNA-methyltransferase (adenine-specific) n=1 Tax=Mycoplasma feriruminatoris TaxID=1179777 RepID=A0A654IQK6_9MOLU|nr:type I restriction-modification system subunit M [Mycoplasma feriruminatoris]WFQ93847.1 type I restriction-modification system subunit M [Mycoplasma feriruminatoris]WFQ95510.1 type I restriction-modification system subunit M [Mycoplasma feriruminatoris]WFQ96328.1 type I restriction-modification system subunit M [Mycoplasma feriruminatoris]VZS00795.1 putative type I restriction enzymeP M protein [Mycoplasma feriruminatoris]